MSFKGQGGGDCSSDLPDKPAVGVTMLNTPYSASKFSYFQETSPQASLLIDGVNARPNLRLAIKLKDPITCDYKLKAGSSLLAQVTNPAGGSAMKAAVILVSWSLEAGQPGSCPARVDADPIWTLKRDVKEGTGELYVGQRVDT